MLGGETGEIPIGLTGWGLRFGTTGRTSILFGALGLGAEGRVMLLLSGTLGLGNSVRMPILLVELFGGLVDGREGEITFLSTVLNGLDGVLGVDIQLSFSVLRVRVLRSGSGLVS